jgi:hypothetical protein
MLDAFNRYKETRDPKDLDVARKYASLLRLDGQAWPALDKLAEEGPDYF